MKITAFDKFLSILENYNININDVIIVNLIPVKNINRGIYYSKYKNEVTFVEFKNFLHSVIFDELEFCFPFIGYIITDSVEIDIVFKQEIKIFYTDITQWKNLFMVMR